MRKSTIFIFLLLLCVSGFFVRLHNVKNSIWRTTDELVFYNMGIQVSKNIRNYNSIPFTEVLVKEKRYVANYLRQSLYKHPPLFTFAVAASLKLFGTSETTAAYPAILFGILLIPLTYLLGRLLFSQPVALLAAFYIWIDPVAIITSQKIWMDTMLAFFMVLSIYWFAIGLFKEKNFYFILSGLASGLATNTKYTGYLATMAVTVYVLFYHRELFKNKTFLFSLILPLLTMIPWLIWNLQVYGFNLAAQGGMHIGVGKALNIIHSKAHLLILIGFLAWAAYFTITKKRTENMDLVDNHSDKISDLDPNRAVKYFSYGVCASICILLIPNIYHAFLLRFLPSYSWNSAFRDHPTWFYFGRLIEFSFPYLFGILSLFTYAPNRSPNKRLAVITATIILIFFICWGNYQSRYILAALPFLLLLSINIIVKMVRYLNQRSSDLKWALLRIAYFFVWSLLLFHTIYINFMVSYPNDLCYY